MKRKIILLLFPTILLCLSLCTSPIYHNTCAGTNKKNKQTNTSTKKPTDAGVLLYLSYVAKNYFKSSFQQGYSILMNAEANYYTGIEKYNNGVVSNKELSLDGAMLYMEVKNVLDSVRKGRVVRQLVHEEKDQTMDNILQRMKLERALAPVSDKKETFIEHVGQLSALAVEPKEIRMSVNERRAIFVSADGDINVKPDNEEIVKNHDPKYNLKVGGKAIEIEGIKAGSTKIIISDKYNKNVVPVVVSVVVQKTMHEENETIIERYEKGLTMKVVPESVSMSVNEKRNIIVIADYVITPRPINPNIVKISKVYYILDDRGKYIHEIQIEGIGTGRTEITVTDKCGDKKEVEVVNVKVGNTTPNVKAIINTDNELTANVNDIIVLEREIVGDSNDGILTYFRTLKTPLHMRLPIFIADDQDGDLLDYYWSITDENNKMIRSSAYNSGSLIFKAEVPGTCTTTLTVSDGCDFGSATATITVNP